MSNYKTLKKELIDTKEAKEEVLGTEKEEVKEIKEELTQNTSPAHTEEDLQKNEKMKKIEPIKDIERISKLKCDYKLFRNERKINKMFVPVNCEICNKPFNEDDNIYVALDKQLNQIFICGECAEGETKEQ